MEIREEIGVNPCPSVEVSIRGGIHTRMFSLASTDAPWRTVRGNPWFNPGMGVLAHRKDAPSSVTCYVLTISDTRTASTDTSGDAIAAALEQAGHQVTGRQIVRDDPAAVRETVSSKAGGVQAIITTGGTGITSRDSTFEAIAALLDKRLDGFGELFRMLSYKEIGSAAMLSRACAGTIGSTAVFSLPGSEHAVRLAMTQLILPELGHVVRELAR